MRPEISVSGSGWDKGLGNLGAQRPPESCFNLFQSFALCLWDESHGEDNVEDAHKSKQPEGSSTGQNILKDISVQDIKAIVITVAIF